MQMSLLAVEMKMKLHLCCVNEMTLGETLNIKLLFSTTIGLDEQLNCLQCVLDDGCRCRESSIKINLVLTVAESVLLLFARVHLS